VLRDCYNGTSNDCSTGSNLNPDDIKNHGTPGASEITGNNTMGDTNRGYTQLTVDSWKVWGNISGSTGDLYYTASTVGRAYQAAYDQYDELEIVELQDNTGYLSMISTGADNEYDLGMVMIGAAGNGGPNAGTVAFPGGSKKVLGVGAINVVDQTLQSYSGRGPAQLAGQIKPDLVGPTDVFAASNQGFTTLIGHTGTSAATPNVGAVAALAYDLLTNNSGGSGRSGATFIDPGFLYSYMIMVGNHPNFDNNSGAGFANCADYGQCWGLELFDYERCGYKPALDYH
jgi:hypothetical protein